MEMGESVSGGDASSGAPRRPPTATGTPENIGRTLSSHICMCHTGIVYISKA